MIGVLIPVLAPDAVHRPPPPQVAGRMAFVSQQSSVNHIFLMDVAASGVGSNPVRLTTDAETENYPSWSPDGTQLVYARLHSAPQPNQPPVTDIRIMNADGSGDRAVLPNTLFSVEPCWSGNNQLVFMSLMGGTGDLEIYVMNIDGSGLRQLTSAGNNADPVWSPDGKRITFGSDREAENKLNIFAMNADGSQQAQLTHFNVPYEAGDTNWSSDGGTIAFECDINGMKQSDPNAYPEVWTINPDGSGEKSTGIPCSDSGCAPRWQPRVARNRPAR